MKCYVILLERTRYSFIHVNYIHNKKKKKLVSEINHLFASFVQTPHSFRLDLSSDSFSHLHC